MITRRSVVFQTERAALLTWRVKSLASWIIKDGALLFPLFWRNNALGSFSLMDILITPPGLVEHTTIAEEFLGEKNKIPRQDMSGEINLADNFLYIGEMRGWGNY